MNPASVKSVVEDDGTVVISLNRPQKRNALTVELMQSLCEEIKRFENSPDCRVIILRGAGLVFCSGLDLQEAAELESALISAEWVAKTFEALASSPLISIAVVQGAAVAGGAGLMASCDFAVVSENVTISFPEVRRGLVPALVLTRLRNRLRDSELRELLLLAEPIDAQRARSLGLVHAVVPDRILMDTAFRMAQTIRRGAPDAVRKTKQLMREIQNRSDTEAQESALHFHTRARSGDEAREGLAAFLEKRDPIW